jgi:hypothetical protein
MASLLGPFPLYAWAVIVAAVAAFVALVLRLAAAPKEIAGVDLTPGEPVTLRLAAAPCSKLRVWGAYELGTDDEDVEVRATFEARSAGRVVGAGEVGRVGARIMRGGRSGWEAFTEAIAAVAVTEGAPFEVRVTISAAAPVLKARLYVSR